MGPEQYQMLFNAYKTKDNIYHLEGLDVDIELSESMVIGNIGYVDSMIENDREYNPEHNGLDDEAYCEAEKLNPVWLNYCVTGGNVRENHSSDGTMLLLQRYISAERIMDSFFAEVRDIGVQGHEDVEALDACGMIDWFKEYAVQYFGIEIDYDGLHKEAICQIGALIAIDKAGYSPKHWQSTMVDKNDEDYKGWTIDAYRAIGIEMDEELFQPQPKSIFAQALRH